jgi:hypothetical protein
LPFKCKKTFEDACLLETSMMIDSIISSGVGYGLFQQQAS